MVPHWLSGRRQASFDKPVIPQRLDGAAKIEKCVGWFGQHRNFSAQRGSGNFVETAIFVRDDTVAAGAGRGNKATTHFLANNGGVEQQWVAPATVTPGDEVQEVIDLDTKVIKLVCNDGLMQSGSSKILRAGVPGSRIDAIGVGE